MIDRIPAAGATRNLSFAGVDALIAEARQRRSEYVAGLVGRLFGRPRRVPAAAPAMPEPVTGYDRLDRQPPTNDNRRVGGAGPGRRHA